jgi:hypothetical protein
MDQIPEGVNPMSTKRFLLTVAALLVLGLAAESAQAQMVTGGYGYGTPGYGAVTYGTPVVGTTVVPAPITSYMAPYTVVYPRRFYGPFYRAGWGGFGPRFGMTRFYRRGYYGYGMRRWW